MYSRNSYWCIRRTFSNLRGIKTHDRQVIEIKEHLMKKNQIIVRIKPFHYRPLKAS